MTGYLGGAVATHLRIADTARATIPLVVGILAWGGLYLRDSRIRQLVPFRRRDRIINLELLGREHERVGREPRPVGIRAHLEKNRRTRGLARGNPQQNAHAHQESRPGRRRGVEVGQANQAGTPVWSHDGIICTGESYKSVVKLTFAKGASLKDPARLFNSSLDGNVRRAIDIHEGEDVDESAFKALVRQAVALNRSGKSKPSK